jgi:hypothetical protein
MRVALPRHLCDTWMHPQVPPLSASQVCPRSAAMHKNQVHFGVFVRGAHNGGQFCGGAKATWEAWGLRLHWLVRKVGQLDTFKVAQPASNKHCSTGDERKGSTAAGAARHAGMLTSERWAESPLLGGGCEGFRGKAPAAMNQQINISGMGSCVAGRCRRADTAVRLQNGDGGLRLAASRGAGRPAKSKNGRTAASAGVGRTRLGAAGRRKEPSRPIK